MKNNYYLIAALLVIAGLVWYFYLRKPKPIPPAATTTPSGSGPTTGTTGTGTTTGTTGTTTGTTGAPNFVGVGMSAKIAKIGYPIYFEDISDDWTTPATPSLYTTADNLNGLLGRIEEIKDFNEFYFTPYPRKKFARLNYNNGERPIIWVEVDAITQA